MDKPSENTSLIANYRAKVESGELRADPQQNLVIEKLSLLANRLGRTPEKGPEKTRGFASAIFGWGRETVREEGLRGEYIYGSVGTGKSMVMQLFVDAVGAAAWRVHFHAFMQGVQKELTEIRKGKAQEPLDEIAKSIAQKCRVLCLDEMQIENIADAMIVGRLFEGIFARGVVLVTTSNRHPDALYKGGLNRHRFTPFIDEIKAHCEIISLDSGVDYRQGDGGEDGAGARYFINDVKGLDAAWDAVDGQEQPYDLKLAGRNWSIARTKPKAAWLEFSEACEVARGAQDYQALADQFPMIWMDNVPQFAAENTSAATRFVTLIDILYEAKSTLYLGLSAPLETLHDDANTQFVFERTLSRLHEMQGANWGE